MGESKQSIQVSKIACGRQSTIQGLHRAVLAYTITVKRKLAYMVTHLNVTVYLIIVYHIPFSTKTEHFTFQKENIKNILNDDRQENNKLHSIISSTYKLFERVCIIK